MAHQITIIGTGLIGTSLGLAFAEHKDKFFRVGHDIDSGIANKAKQTGALDKIVFNLPSAVEDADVVFLAVPFDQVKETLEIIKDFLKSGVVVLDCSLNRTTSQKWAEEIMPAERYYVGFTPTINPMFLHDFDNGPENADGDLFLGGLISITAPFGTPNAAIKLASDLTEMIGASPLFADLLEIDSYMSTNHLLPQLLSAALVNATVDQPGWQECRKFAGRPYAQATNSIQHADTPAALAQTILSSKDAVDRVLGNLIVELQKLKSAMRSENTEEFSALLVKAHDARAFWWHMRKTGDWKEENQPQALEEIGRENILQRMVGISKTKGQEG